MDWVVVRALSMHVSCCVSKARKEGLTYFIKFNMSEKSKLVSNSKGSFSVINKFTCSLDYIVTTKNALNQVSTIFKNQM